MAGGSEHITGSTARRKELLARGYVRVAGVPDANLLPRIQVAARRRVAAASPAHRSTHRWQGTSLRLTEDPVFADLVSDEAALAVLTSLGARAPTFSDGYLISKPPGGPGLYWHQDWYAWEDPRSYDPEPPQLGLMYYLTDTTRENGCLRVIPGSHRRHLPIHDQIGDSHRSHAHQPAIVGDDAAFSDHPDALDLPASPGELLIVDARLLHATHPNRSSEERTMITLWYQPDVASLPERIQAQIHKKRHLPADDWPSDARDRWMSVLVEYRGGAEPYDRQPHRRPIAPARGMPS